LKKNLLYFMLILSIVIIAGCTRSYAPSTNNNNNPIEPTQSENENSCKDYENGVDQYVNGELTVCMYGAEEPGDEPGMMCARHNDLCDQDSDELYEKYCEGDEMKFEVIPCKYGCENGACLQFIERCQFPAGTDCVDKATTTSDSMEIALRNNIGFTIEISHVNDEYCSGFTLVAVGTSDPYEQINNQEVPNNEIYRIKLQGCEFDADPIFNNVEVTYKNTATGLSHIAIGEIESIIT